MVITDYIPKGHQNAVSREYLRTILHMTDRQIRREIAESEEQIFSYGGGYFRHKGKKDIPYEEDYLRQEAARAKEMARKVKRIKAAIYG